MLDLTTSCNISAEREYRVTTFTLPERSNTEKLYMLGIDVAKAAGHTDSSLLARRYHSLVKAYLTDSEKVLLLETGIGSGSNFRNDRPVTIYAARNIYKYMGAAIIKSEIMLSGCPPCRCTQHLRLLQTGAMLSTTTTKTLRLSDVGRTVSILVVSCQYAIEKPLLNVQPGGTIGR